KFNIPTYLTKRLGESQNVISRLASRPRTTGRVCDRPRSEAPPTDHNHDQYLGTSVLRHGSANTTQLQAYLPDVRGTRISRHVNPLSPRHHIEHLQWTQEHVTRSMQQWSTVWFIVESLCRTTQLICQSIKAFSYLKTKIFKY
uniref:Uncharacterized protein n=1 Tax=Oryzias latipes TaxID=8090 RepID=A0A3P9KIE5_ORYLA